MNAAGSTNPSSIDEENVSIPPLLPPTTSTKYSTTTCTRRSIRHLRRGEMMVLLTREMESQITQTTTSSGLVPPPPPPVGMDAIAITTATTTVTSGSSSATDMDRWSIYVLLSELVFALLRAVPSQAQKSEDRNGKEEVAEDAYEKHDKGEEDGSSLSSSVSLLSLTVLEDEYKAAIKLLSTEGVVSANDSKAARLESSLSTASRDGFIRIKRGKKECDYGLLLGRVLFCLLWCRRSQQLSKAAATSTSNTSNNKNSNGDSHGDLSVLCKTPTRQEWENVSEEDLPALGFRGALSLYIVEESEKEAPPVGVGVADKRATEGLAAAPQSSTTKAAVGELLIDVLASLVWRALPLHAHTAKYPNGSGGGSISSGGVTAPSTNPKLLSAFEFEDAFFDTLEEFGLDTGFREGKKEPMITDTPAATVVTAEEKQGSSPKSVTFPASESPLITIVGPDTLENDAHDAVHGKRSLSPLSGEWRSEGMSPSSSLTSEEFSFFSPTQSILEQGSFSLKTAVGGRRNAAPGAVPNTSKFPSIAKTNPLLVKNAAGNALGSAAEASQFTAARARRGLQPTAASVPPTASTLPAASSLYSHGGTYLPISSFASDAKGELLQNNQRMALSAGVTGGAPARDALPAYLQSKRPALGPPPPLSSAPPNQTAQNPKYNNQEPRAQKRRIEDEKATTAADPIATPNRNRARALPVGEERAERREQGEGVVGANGGEEQRRERTTQLRRKRQRSASCGVNALLDTPPPSAQKLLATPLKSTAPADDGATPLRGGGGIFIPATPSPTKQFGASGNFNQPVFSLGPTRSGDFASDDGNFINARNGRGYDSDTGSVPRNYYRGQPLSIFSNEIPATPTPKEKRSISAVPPSPY